VPAGSKSRGFLRSIMAANGNVTMAQRGREAEKGKQVQEGDDGPGA